MYQNNELALSFKIHREEFMSFVDRILSLFISEPSEANISIQFRQKIPFILGTDLLCMFFMIVFVFAEMAARGGGVSPYTFGILFVVCTLAVSLVMLRKGRFYMGAAICSCGLFLCCVVTMFFIPSAGLIDELYRDFAICLLAGACNQLVVLNKRQIVIFFAAMAAAIVSVFFIKYMPAYHENSQRCIVVLFVCTVSLLLSGVIFFMITLMSEKLYRMADDNTACAQRSLERVTGLVGEVKEGIALGVSLTDAANKLQRAVSGMQNMYGYLQKNSGELLHMSDAIRQSFDVIISKTEDMKSSTHEQNASINESSAALTEISANLSNISAIASNRRASMQDLVRNFDDQKEQIKNLMNAMETMRLSSEGIASFTHTVENIASQTGLLAMNASIEAAHAGVSGKGFAVIAQEIRKLSEETSKNAGHISEMLKKNEEVVQNTAVAVNDFASSTEKQAEESTSIINSIEEILSGIAEMDIGTREVMKAIQNIVNESLETEVRVNTVSEEITKQQENVTAISDFSGSMNDHIFSFRDGLKNIESATDLVAATGEKNREMVNNINISLAKMM